MVDNECTYLFPQDDWYEGFFIPKGTMCPANIWYDSRFAFLSRKKPDYFSRSMNRDPTIYVGSSLVSTGNPLIFTLSWAADADDFNPDRFIGPDGQVTPPIADTKDGAFVCDSITVGH